MASLHTKSARAAKLAPPQHRMIDPMTDLRRIPGVGKSIAQDLINIGILSVEALRGLDPERLYIQSNEYVGVTQDRCLLYVFRCATYFANEPNHDPDKLKWWNWKD